MAVNTVEYGAQLTANTDRGPSPSIWKDCPVNDIVENPNYGLHFFDDFERFPLPGTQTTQIQLGKYKVFNTGSGTVSGLSAVNSVEMPGGILQINLDTDNDSGSIADSNPSYLLSGLASNSGKLWFEARIATKETITNGVAIMLGLAEVEQWTLATAVPFNASDAITNAASFVGFRSLEDLVSSAKTIDTVYSDRATSFTNVQATASSFVANTFIKLGMVYNPTDSAGCIRFYINGVETSTPITKATLTGLTNLDANALGLIFAACADSAGTSSVLYMDWWRCAQLVPTI